MIADERADAESPRHQAPRLPASRRRYNHRGGVGVCVARSAYLAPGYGHRRAARSTERHHPLGADHPTILRANPNELGHHRLLGASSRRVRGGCRTTLRTRGDIGQWRPDSRSFRFHGTCRLATPFAVMSQYTFCPALERLRLRGAWPCEGWGRRRRHIDLVGAREAHTWQGEELARAAVFAALSWLRHQHFLLCHHPLGAVVRAVRTFPPAPLSQSQARPLHTLRLRPATRQP